MTRATRIRLPDSKYRQRFSVMLTREEEAKLRIIARQLRKSMARTVIDAIEATRFKPSKLFYTITIDLDRLARAEIIATSLGYKDAKEWLEVSFEQSIDSQWPTVKEFWKWGVMDTKPVILKEGKDGLLHNEEDLDAEDSTNKKDEVPTSEGDEGDRENE